MKFDTAYSFHNGVALWKERRLYEWIIGVFDAPKVKIKAGSTGDIRDHVKNELGDKGWAFNVRIDPAVNLNVFARKSDIAFQIQTGNISRYAYDILKIQHLYFKKEIEVAALAVPTRETANVLGSAVVNDKNVWNELNVFDRTITVPIMIIAFK